MAQPDRAARARSFQTQLRDLEESWNAVARHLLARRWAAPGLDLTHPQYYALHHICQGRSIRLPDLAEAMRLHEAMTGRVVDRLVRAGLASRRLDPSDRRTIVLEPTSQGRQTLAAVRRLRFEELSAMLERLEPREREELIRLFRKMAAEPAG